MKLATAVVVLVVVLAPPILWVVWWLLADLGERANGSYRAARYTSTGEPRRRAA